MTDEGRGDTTVTRADLEELAGSISDLRDAFEELREATTPREKQAARERVADEQDDLDATAARLGVSRAKLEESIKAARNAERKEELREPVRELLAELAAEQNDDGNDDGDDGDDGEKAKPKPKPKPKAAPVIDGDGNPPPVDDPPVVEHWSERGVSGLLK